MAKRQSKKPRGVSADEASARAGRVGERIRERMRERGLVDDQGRFELSELARQIGALSSKAPRAATVGEWVHGRSVPSADYDRQLAEVLGMTLDELAGIALDQEPQTEAWLAFKTSAVYATATPDELQELRRRTAPRGHSFVPGYYEMELTMLRTMTRPD